MSYVTYTTDALVCGTYNRNTADRLYLLFTKEAGMLYADARSAREERSRQRYALQEFSLVRVSLIKGKRGWRVGSILALKNFYQQAVDKEARGSVVSLFRLLRRFVKGEEVVPDLFQQVVQAVSALGEPVERRFFVLQVVQVNLLTLLGYVDKKHLPLLLQSVNLRQIASHYSSAQEKKIGKLYTQAVSVSHL